MATKLNRMLTHPKGLLIMQLHDTLISWSCQITSQNIGMIHIWRTWILSNFHNPHPSCPSTSKILPPLNLGRPISNEPSPSLNDSQSVKKNIIQRWLLYVNRSFLKVGFRFQYQLINFAWLSFDFFSFSRSLTIYFFVALYSCECNCPKILRNVFYL